MDNMAVRMTAADQLADRIGKGAIAPVTALLNEKGISARQYIHALWVLERLNAETSGMLKTAAANQDPLIRVHAMRILSEEKPDSISFYPVILHGLKDNDRTYGGRRWNY